jgi:hypothetical protein
MAREITHSPASALPATREQLLAQRTLKRPSTLLEQVDVIHVELWSDSKYRALLEAVWNEHAVEGSLIDDSVSAAQMIREYARKKGIESVTEAKLHDIRRALNGVRRRYGLGRSQRLNGHASA